MKFEKRDLVYIVIILILLFFGYLGYNQLNNMNQKFDNYENTIAALNDSITVNMENGFITYSKKSPEIYLDELLKSEYFKTLSEDQQEYYKELSKIKKLLAASKAELEKQGELLAEINMNNNPGNIDLATDSISFKLGTELAFKEQDTTKHLQWNSKITLDTNIKFNFDYKYKFDVLTTFERQKDKSILVKYKVDDPELKINDMQNFIIPPEQKHSKIGRWYDKNKKVINIISGSVLFLGGGYLGYTIAQ